MATAIEISKILLQAAIEVQSGRKQSYRSAVYAACRRIHDDGSPGSYSAFQDTVGLLYDLYGVEHERNQVYHGGWSHAHWLDPSSKRDMVFALIFAHTYVESEMVPHAPK